MLRIHWSWLLAVAIIAIAAFGLAWFLYLRPGGGPITIDYYRIVDEDSIIIGTTTGACDESRVTEVAETPHSVTITVHSFTFDFGPCPGVGIPIELAVELDRPLGDRPVFDHRHQVERRTGEG
jgi:hypothetical protein